LRRQSAWAPMFSDPLLLFWLDWRIASFPTRQDIVALWPDESIVGIYDAFEICEESFNNVLANITAPSFRAYDQCKSRNVRFTRVCCWLTLWNTLYWRLQWLGWFGQRRRTAAVTQKTILTVRMKQNRLYRL
jgi:hypothetical protein